MDNETIASFSNRIDVLRRAINSLSNAKTFLKVYYNIGCFDVDSNLARTICQEDSLLLDFYYKECRLPGSHVETTDCFDYNKFENEARRRIVGEKEGEVSALVADNSSPPKPSTSLADDHYFS